MPGVKIEAIGQRQTLRGDSLERDLVDSFGPSPGPLDRCRVAIAGEKVSLGDTLSQPE